MRGADEYYYQLLEISAETFEQKLFIVSYHALSSAMYCAIELNEQEKKDEIAKIAVEQFEEVCKHYAPSSIWNEPLEVILYRSLVRIADPHSKFRST